MYSHAVFHCKFFRFGGLFALLTLALCCGCLAQDQPAPAVEIPLWRFDELTAPSSCRTMGRFQDTEYCHSQVVDQVLALGKNAIPILISELTDERRTKHSIYDLWKFTAAGDIANSILFDLFTAPDWRVSYMSELDPLERDCQKPGESCWRKFLHKKGRKFVQEQWAAAWNAHKDSIYWDDKARCFRIAASAPQDQFAGHVASPPTSGSRSN